MTDQGKDNAGTHKEGLLLSPDDMKKDVDQIYVPLVNNLRIVVERIRGLELDVPIYIIARMEVHDVFTRRRHSKVRKEIFGFLHRTNDYRKYFWELEKKAGKVFDTLMYRQGSFAPTTKEYRSLKIALRDDLLKSDGKLWALNYDTYLDAIEQRSVKNERTGAEHRDGSRMYRAIKQKLMPTLHKLTGLRSEAEASAIRLLKISLYLREHPWGVLTYSRSVSSALGLEDTEKIFGGELPPFTEINMTWASPQDRGSDHGPGTAGKADARDASGKERPLSGKLRVMKGKTGADPEKRTNPDSRKKAAGSRGGR